MFTWKIPFLMLFVVGSVIVALSNTPFITPTTINPFMLVIEAVMTILLSPAMGDWMARVGMEKT
jgi:hypothetical protein